MKPVAHVRSAVAVKASPAGQLAVQEAHGAWAAGGVGGAGEAGCACGCCGAPKACGAGGEVPAGAARQHQELATRAVHALRRCGVQVPFARLARFVVVAR
jgi:hypothetical protein